MVAAGNKRTLPIEVRVTFSKHCKLYVGNTCDFFCEFFMLTFPTYQVERWKMFMQKIV